MTDATSRASRVSERVVSLADRRPDEEEAGADDELHEELDAREALLDRLLVLLGRDVVREVAEARQEAPGTTGPGTYEIRILPPKF